MKIMCLLLWTQLYKYVWEGIMLVKIVDASFSWAKLWFFNHNNSKLWKVYRERVVKVLPIKVCIGKPPALLSVFCLRVSPRFWSPAMKATQSISCHLCVQVSVDSAHHFVLNIRGSETFNVSSSEFKESYNHNFYMESKATLISLLFVLRHLRRKEADILKRTILFNG